MQKKYSIPLLAATLALPAAINAAALSMDAAEAISVSPGMSVAYPISEDSVTAVKSNEAILEDAIKVAKKYIGNTDRFAKLTHNISDYGDVKLVYLYWRESTNEGEYLNAVVTEDGVLLQYRLGSYDEPGLPTISKADAVRLAYEFVKKANPAVEILSEDHATVEYYRWEGYGIAFHSMHDGKKIDGNVIRVTVNPNGKVTYYDAFSFARGLILPETSEKIISEDDAKKTLKTKLPLELVYKSFYDFDYKTGESKATIKLVYRLPAEYSTKVVDAETGNIIEVEQRYRMYSEEQAPVAAAGVLVKSNSDVRLTPAEQKTVNVQAGLLTAKDVEAKLRAVAEFGLDDSLKVASSTLYTVKSPFDGKLSYKWSLSLNDADETTFVYADVNAKTGEVLSISGYSSNEDSGFYYGTYKTPSEFKYTEAECEEAALKLLKSLYGEKFDGYEKTEYTGINPLANDQISSYTFNFVRVVNGAKFYDDTISVTVNPDTLTVNSLDFSYTDTTFPSAVGALDVSAAVDAYFKVVELESYYVVGTGKADGKVTVPDYVYSTEEKVLVPVYGYDYYGFVDAKNGALLDGNGEPAEYKPTVYFKSTSFKDIADSPYYKAIMLLYNMDIVESGDSNFRPTEAIAADDFRSMLEKAGFPLYDDETEGREAAVELSLEDAMYAVVSALGYSEVADLNAIFKAPFDDEAKVSADRVGAVAIAKALGLTGGLSLEDAPDLTVSLTRGEAAQLVYNLLNRNA